VADVTKTLLNATVEVGPSNFKREVLLFITIFPFENETEVRFGEKVTAVFTSTILVVVPTPVKVKEEPVSAFTVAPDS